MTEDCTDIELFRGKLQSRKSVVGTRRQHAVCVRNAFKSYGTKKEPLVILDGLNMTVPKGVIYGLLGASGCGKTTLLTCIVGRKKMDSGEIWVLGGRPGAKGSGVPGPRIGYMPQDIAQYGEFTIRETLLFYGWVAGMKNDEIKERADFLVQLFMLPNADKMVKSLSLGQQRRVSLASALLHEPELLILDEPTVGVDPLLREIIWNHFVEITRSGHTTIIITTHYIDETRQADLIGLMRGGSFLAEEPPMKLMRQMHADTLDDVFLKLSIMQNMSRRRRSILVRQASQHITLPAGIVNKAVVIDEPHDPNESEHAGEFGDNVSMQSSSGRRGSIKTIAEEDDEDDSATMPVLPPYMEPPTEISDYLILWRANHMKALIWKNFLWMIRNIPMLVFLVLIPAVVTAFFFICIGHDPMNLPIAVVNYETNSSMNCDGPMMCNSTQLSCKYLRYLQKRDFVMVHFDSEETAKVSLETGKTYASLVLRHNYSRALSNRIRSWEAARKWNTESSTIYVDPDRTNKAITTFMLTAFYDAYKSFITEYLISCDYDGRVLKEPIKWEKPVYGADNPDFSDFVTPGALVSLCFCLGAVLTAFVVFNERREGTFQRYIVSGISEIELLSAHFICEFAICLLQTLLATIFAFAVFRATIEGSLVLATVLIICCGICGMGYGFAISCVCDNERTVNNLILGTFIPIITLSGIVWPAEGMHYVLQIISKILPITQASEGLRSIMQRGWGFSTSTIYTGFITLGVWTVIYMALSILAIKYKKT